MRSEIKKIGSVIFPEFTNERVYMVGFSKESGLPSELLRWQPMVNSMLEGVDTDQEIFITVDQGVIEKDSTQRREGPHIDGNWITKGYATHKVMAWGPTPGPTWNLVNLEKGGIILASSCDGAKAFTGEVEGLVGIGGDCSHMDLTALTTEILTPDTAYIGNVTMIHEAMPAQQTGNRSFIRLTLPENYEYAA